MLVSFAANLVANDRPLIMHWNNHWYFPALFDYMPKDFGKTGFVVDYFALEPEMASHGFAVFPPIKQADRLENLSFIPASIRATFSGSV